VEKRKMNESAFSKVSGKICAAEIGMGRSAHSKERLFENTSLGLLKARKCGVGAKK
jgi:hypothetical protein